MLNLYTGTPQISSGEGLAKIFMEQQGGEVFIIGSGEIIKNPMRYLGDGIWETMQEFHVEEVFLGRDRATKIWKYSPASGQNLGQQ
jgi:hypothetical protein